MDIRLLGHIAIWDCCCVFGTVAASGKYGTDECSSALVSAEEVMSADRHFNFVKNWQNLHACFHLLVVFVETATQFC